MNYRQWKKNYKKRYGVNPPISVDKRKQRKLALKVVKNIDMSMLESQMYQVAANIGEALKKMDCKCIFWTWQCLFGARKNIYRDGRSNEGGGVGGNT